MQKSWITQHQECLYKYQSFPLLRSIILSQNWQISFLININKTTENYSELIFAGVLEYKGKPALHVSDPSSLIGDFLINPQSMETPNRNISYKFQQMRSLSTCPIETKQSSYGVYPFQMLAMSINTLALLADIFYSPVIFFEIHQNDLHQAISLFISHNMAKIVCVP